MAAARLCIEGRVQGVGYRWWAVQTARALALRGWVRNRLDGSVELLAIGEAQVLERMIEACRRGPEGAAVTAVHRSETEDDGAAGFSERPTA